MLTQFRQKLDLTGYVPKGFKCSRQVTEVPYYIFQIIEELHRLSNANKSIEKLLFGPSDVLEHFNEIFPHLNITNKIGQVTDDDFSSWTPGNNEISVELDQSAAKVFDKKSDVYIGGPAAMFAAVLQANSGEDTENILIGHDGVRGTSNWKGS